MLDFDQLRTPPDDGDVLVLPEPALLASAARINHETLRYAEAPLLDSTIAECRRRTRETILGTDDTLAIVTGHQPAFVHPGVWAKYIVAHRLAETLDGVALNLVVDHDTPKRTTIAVPVVADNGLSLRNVPYAFSPVGYAFEQIPAQTPADVDAFRSNLQDCLGPRYPQTPLDAFFDGIATAENPRDWVHQQIAGRHAIEQSLGQTITDRRVSDIWCSPLLLEMLLHAERFAESYNGALARYRREQRVRDEHRPIPDLLHADGRTEIPVWVYRPDQRRRRLFVARRTDQLDLFADDEPVATLPVTVVSCCDCVADTLARLKPWRLRPRALALTLWARLLLADLFIHGIGGAKYDRITDTIIQDYCGIEPPTMACVSATLHLGLPVPHGSADDLRRARHALRDLTYNPQRHLPAEPDIDATLQRRRDLIERANALKGSGRENARQRRRVFDEIRATNTTLLEHRPDERQRRQEAVTDAENRLEQARIAHGREYFFGLYDRQRLRTLLDALPETRDFAL